jgi:type IX secretion system PorP/SprF family membrane protein
MKRIKLILVFIIATQSFLNAQDISFSQKFVSSQYINPALTGIFNGTVRMGVQYRSQWNNPLETSFQTYAASGDLNYRMNRWEHTSKDLLGVGILFVNDRIEGFDFNSSLIGLSFAFHKSLDKRFNHYISAGIQGGIIQKNINYDQLQFGDQYNNIDAYSFPTAEPRPSNNFAIEDINVGINYLYNPSKKFSIRAGLAFQHLSTPNLSFFRFNDNYIENDILRKITFHSTASFGINPFAHIQPRLIIHNQGPFFDTELAATFKFTTFERDYLTFHLGLGTHLVRDLESVGFSTVVPFMGLQVNNILIGMSYDVGISTLARHNRNFSTFEFSLTYLGQYDNQPLFCPKF